MFHGKCNQCGNVATDQEWLSAQNAACPKCGHKHFTIEVESTIESVPTGALKITTRDHHHKSDKKVRLKHFVGLTSNAAGDPVHKEQLFDRNANYYFERVVDVKTGETIRLCEEKLSDHIGRGSNRTKES